METVALQLLWAFVGALLGVLLKPAWDYVASWRGEFTGEWRQVIAPFDGEPEKIATVRVRHVGDRLYGTTERTKPRLDYPQKWKVEARIKRDLVFGTYWPEDASALPGSYGTLQFKIVHENKLEGFYVRARPAVGLDGTVNYQDFRVGLRSIPIYWERVGR